MEHRGDPGAVQYGNFMNYYQFHSAAERFKLLPTTEIWNPPDAPTGDETTEEPYLVLDVGCNSGVFTTLLHEFLEEHLKRPVYILGVDIDERLVERSKEDNTNVDRITYSHVDIMNDDNFVTVLDYLNQHQRKKFDAICCYSITMWIHLNHHDAGLQRFLVKLSHLAQLFVVEPQPWKCYQTAERRLKKTGEVFPLFLQLKWRSDVEQQIEKYVEQVLDRRKVFESTPTKWQRRICFYR